jgi:hypothetical protein
MVAQTMRLQAMVFPNASDHHEGDSQLCSQTSATPMCTAVIGAPASPLKNASLSFGCIPRAAAPLIKGQKAGSEMRS